MKKKVGITLLAFILFSVLTGCGGYYQVKDPTTDKVYYTRDIDKEKGGAVRFEDENTGAKVTLQASEVKKIDRKEYRQAIEGKD